MINKTLVSMMLVIAAGCGGGGGSDNSEVEQPQPEPTITPVTPEISKPDHESALNDVSQVITAIDASIYSVLLDLNAAIGDNLHFHIDNQ